MSDIEFVPPTDELVRSIAADMRPADVAEVWAASHSTPLQALMKGWRESDYVTVATCEGQPLVMFGLVKRGILSSAGVPWMLGAQVSLKHRREFLNRSPAVIDEMLTICPNLYNMVHSKNRDSIRWLKWLGFTIDDPVVHGREGELFHKFHMQR